MISGNDLRSPDFQLSHSLKARIAVVLNEIAYVHVKGRRGHQAQLQFYTLNGLAIHSNAAIWIANVDCGIDPMN